MATQTVAYKPVVFRSTLTKSFARKFDELFRRFIPRPCMILSVGLVLIGLGIPFLMLIDLLPTSLLLGFVGLAFIGIGGSLTLYFVGDF